MSGYRPPYTVIQERKMLRYIIINKGYYYLRGRGFWISMAEELKINRTWQSLKEHFRKCLVTRLNNPLYQLEEDEIAQIRDGYLSTGKSHSPVSLPKKKDLVEYQTTSSSSDTE